MSDIYDDEDEQKQKKSSEFAKLLEDSFRNTKKRLSVGDKVQGEVLSIGKDDVYVSTGTMYDGLVPRKELLDPDGKLTCKVGDSLDLYVTQARGSEIYLSPKPTSMNLAEDIEDAFDKMLPIEGRVAEVCKGGFRVSILGKMAFCPISQIDSKRVEVPEEYIGKKFEFMITQFGERGKNIVVSRRKFLDEQKGLSESAFLEERKSGDLLKGRITRLETFGAFVEIQPGVEGLIHISELSWSRVSHPQDVVSVGQEVDVKLLKTEEKEGRMKISLSLKQAGSEPWKNLPIQIKAGHVVEGKVTRCMKFGAFVEISPGIEGLVPLSEMSYTKRVIRSDELMREGERVSVMIKDIQAIEHRILLSLRDAGGDPWVMVPQNFPVGAIVKGKVDRREPYGLFIQLTEGVVGLLPKSKALEDSQFPFDKLRIGDEVTIQVGELNIDDRKMSLRVPQDAGSEDWKTFQQGASTSFGTLGDQFRHILEKKKGNR
jgi:small subunit ribosomal protein S1